MTDKPAVWREIIYRKTFASPTPLPLTCWRYRVPQTGLAGGASSWEAAIKRVRESLTEHRAAEAA